MVDNRSLANSPKSQRLPSFGSVEAPPRALNGMIGQVTTAAVPEVVKVNGMLLVVAAPPGIVTFDDRLTTLVLVLIRMMLPPPKPLEVNCTGMPLLMLT